MPPALYSLALAIVLTLSAIFASAQPATIEAVPGAPALMLANYDLASLGCETTEFFFSGVAASYELSGAATPDGNWTASTAATAPYATRMVVVRPADPAKFNGTVLVEWLNVTAGRDAPAGWMVAHREILRRGYAYVAVSAQTVGIEGGQSLMSQAPGGLKQLNPERYAALSHPGDAFAFDIFTQAGAALKAPDSSGLLGGLKPQRVTAMGESQSAAFLVSYINAVDPIARVYDAYFVHSRFGSSASLDGSGMAGAQGKMPPHAQFRADLRVPVLTLITETDMVGGMISGYFGARQPEHDRLRVWEVAGSAHADNYLFMGALLDSGQQDIAELAKVFVPNATVLGPTLAAPVNPGMPHHYVTQAAITALDQWLRTGTAPASTPLLEMALGENGAAPNFVRDDKGLAQGGIRTPWVDVPTIRLSGTGNSGGFIAMLSGIGEPFDAATLENLYPGGKTDYLKRFEAALDAAIQAGHLLLEDRQEILDIAAINFDIAP